MSKKKKEISAIFDQRALGDSIASSGLLLIQFQQTFHQQLILIHFQREHRIQLQLILNPILDLTLIII